MPLAARLRNVQEATVCICREPQAEPSKFSPVGNGVVVDAHRGLIATAKHVLRRPSPECRERRAEGQKLPVRRVWHSDQWDLSLIQVEFERMPGVVELANVALRPGAMVIRCGYSPHHGRFELRSEIGFFAYQRKVMYEGQQLLALQLGCADGDSGGPVVDSNTGHLVGITSANTHWDNEPPVPQTWAVPVAAVRELVNTIAV